MNNGFWSFNDCFGWYARHELFRHNSIEAIIKLSREHYITQLRNELEYFVGFGKTWEGGESNIMSNDANEDLFAKFYNHEKILIANMSSDEFKAHEEELAKVAFEAKARLTAVVDKKREDNAKLRSSQKEWLMPRSGAEDALVSDAINAVGQRKKRMNKIEKLNEQLAGFVDDETRKMLIANVERKATDSNVNLISFVKAKTDENLVEELKAKVEDKPVVAFDPSKLVGLK